MTAPTSYRRLIDVEVTLRFYWVMKEIRRPVQTNSKFTFEIVTLGGINKSIKNLKSDIQLPKKIFYLLQ